MNHSNAAHRALDILIDNAIDENHDRDRDDAIAAFEPHIESIRALAHFAHDDTCPDRTSIECDTPDELDDAAFTMLELEPDCIRPLIDAINTLLYATPRDLMP